MLGNSESQSPVKFFPSFIKGFLFGILNLILYVIVCIIAGAILAAALYDPQADYDVSIVVILVWCVFVIFPIVCVAPGLVQFLLWRRRKPLAAQMYFYIGVMLIPLVMSIGFYITYSLLFG